MLCPACDVILYERVSFYMMQIDALASARRPQELIREAAPALFETLGPVILICHSQSGPFAWILANDHPESVKAMISIEPSGPPFTNVQTGTPLVGADGRPVNYGISHVPLTFDPPLSSPAEIELVPWEAPGPGRISGFLPRLPARQLPRLQGIPALVLSAEASYHTPFDYLTAMFLKQAGVDAEYVMLGDVGIHGNGHMMMIGKGGSSAVATIALLAGMTLGELLGIEKWLLRVSAAVGKRIPMLRTQSGETGEQLFLSGFVLMVCSTAGVLGAMTAQLTGDFSLLLTKALLDFVLCVFYAVSAGPVMSLLSIPVLAVLYGIYGGTSLLAPFITEQMTLDFSLCGGMIQIVNAIKTLRGKEVGAANLIPALLLVLLISRLTNGAL